MPPKSTRRTTTFNPKALLERVEEGRSVATYGRKQAVFSQGDPADAVFYVQKGRVKLTVVSKQGKEAVLGFVGADMFFGEGCLAGQPLRMSTATAVEDTTVLRFQKKGMIRLLHADPKFSELFSTYLLSRNIRFEEDLVDQLFNSSEKRLARILLMLAHFGKEDTQELVIPKISQEILAGMVGTTRSRVSHFMNKFRKLGLIKYNGGLLVHSSLLNIVLHD
ncbi:MAG: Crp/Fnr family transcriptional regulator [Terriglobia bacterium]|jgi:CRP-like cAMP-binding protein